MPRHPYLRNRFAGDLSAAIGRLAFCIAAQYLPVYALAVDSDASDNNFEDIYRIELVVFADTEVSSGQSMDDVGLQQEQWREPDDLAYPKNLVFLREAAANPEASPSSGLTASGADNPQTSAGNNLTARIPPLLSTLDKQQSSLAAVVSALQRRTQYRLLFHEVWNQELLERTAAPSIPLTGGSRYDDWYELGGSISFSKERFLHVTTDLWLSEFSYRNEFNEQRPWYSGRYENYSWLPPIPALSHASTQDGRDSNSGEDAGFHYPTGRDYKVLRTYVLREYRRLKRDEVHYLDHPAFGVIVLVSKYGEPADS